MRKNAFTEEQRKRIYDLVQQSMTSFFDENNREFTLLKNLSTNKKVYSFITQFKQSFAGSEQSKETINKTTVTKSPNAKEDRVCEANQEISKEEVKEINGYPKFAKESNRKEQNKMKGKQIESSIESKKTKELEHNINKEEDKTKVIKDSKKSVQKEGSIAARTINNPKDTTTNRMEEDILNKEASNKDYSKFHTRNYTADDNFKKIKSTLSKEASKKQQMFIRSHATSDTKPKNKSSHAKNLSQIFTKTEELAVDKQAKKDCVESNSYSQDTIKHDKTLPKKNEEAKGEISPSIKANAKGGTIVFMDKGINKREIQLPERSFNKVSEKNKSPYNPTKDKHPNTLLKKGIEKKTDLRLKEVNKNKEQHVAEKKELSDSKIVDTPIHHNQLSKIKEDESDIFPEKEDILDNESSDEVEPPKNGKVKLRLSTKKHIERLTPYFILILRFYLRGEIAKTIAANTEVSTEFLENIKNTLQTKSEEVEEKIKSLKKSHPNSSTPVIFDIGINKSFLEIDQIEESKEFYNLSTPSTQSLLVMITLTGFLGRWELIEQGNPDKTWRNIKNHFSTHIGYNISKYFKSYRRILLKETKEDGYLRGKCIQIKTLTKKTDIQESIQFEGIRANKNFILGNYRTIDKYHRNYQ